MTITITPRLGSRPVYKVILLLAGFGVALVLRVLVGGVVVASSARAGLAFAACLALLGLWARTRLQFTVRIALVGSLGGLTLCLPAAVARVMGSTTHPPAGNYLAWAAVVAVVAVAEEYFLRGALYDATTAWLGEWPAVIIAATAFAALHVPLYGWPAVPLDFAVGLWLGMLRATSGTATAPAIAHALADLVAWWLL